MAKALFQQYAKPKDKNILDLYCGAGTIGLSMSDEAKNIIGVEIVPEAVEDAKFNASNNGIENARFICADATEAAAKLAQEGIKTDVVIVDPPRKGCTEELINTIANNFKPERVVYVSCDVATLARDIKIFESLGYKLTEYTPVDLFPRTAHVETVVLLSREKADDHIRFSINTEDLKKNVGGYATYGDIKAYVLEKFGLKVSSLYIAQTKDKCGIKERENYYIGEGKSKELICPPEKEQAIMDAFRHFGMLRD